MQLNRPCIRLSNELVKAYVETDFVVLEPQEFVMKIGSPCQELLQLYQQEEYSEAAFICFSTSRPRRSIQR